VQRKSHMTQVTEYYGPDRRDSEPTPNPTTVTRRKRHDRVTTTCVRVLSQEIAANVRPSAREESHSKDNRRLSTTGTHAAVPDRPSAFVRSKTFCLRKRHRCTYVVLLAPRPVPMTIITVKTVADVSRRVHDSSVSRRQNVTCRRNVLGSPCPITSQKPLVRHVHDPNSCGRPNVRSPCHIFSYTLFEMSIFQQIYILYLINITYSVITLSSYTRVRVESR